MTFKSPLLFAVFVVVTVAFAVACGVIALMADWRTAVLAAIATAILSTVRVRKEPRK